MKLQFHHERVLAVMAHPDDADLMTAGLLARARQDGAEIAIHYMCLGDRGQPDPPIDSLPDVRFHEAEVNARALGATISRGSAPDGTLADSPAERQALLSVYRAFRPTLVLTHPPEDYHPDHRACAALAEAATWFSASKGFATEGFPALSLPPSLWYCDTFGMTGFQPAIFVDVSPFGTEKASRLRAHASQLPRSSGGAMHPFESLVLEQMKARGRESLVEFAEAYRPCLTYKRTRAW